MLYCRNRMYRGAWYINTRSLLLLFNTREWCCRHRGPFRVRILRIIKHNDNDCLSMAAEATGVASQTEDGPRNRRVAANWHCEQSRHGEPCQVFAFRATVFLWNNKIFRDLCARKIMYRCGKTRARETQKNRDIVLTNYSAVYINYGLDTHYCCAVWYYAYYLNKRGAQRW